MLFYGCEDNPKLSSSGKQYIENPSNSSFISMASLWEIAIKMSLGKLKLKIPYKKFVNWLRIMVSNFSR